MSLLIDFVLPALVVSLAALAALRLAPAAPPGLRLALASAGLAAWLVPWPSIGWPFASAIAPGVAWIGEGGTQLAAVREGLIAATQAAVPPMLSPSPWWLIVFLPGLCWFAGDLCAHGVVLGRWRRISRPGDELLRFVPAGFDGLEIRVLPGSSTVVAAGALRPTIFIGDRIVDEDALRTALTHEACHARRRDPLWLLLITLVARLYCFNPIVLALKRQAILAIETACDEACARRLGRPQYRRSLARLVLEREQGGRLALMPSLHTPGLNFTRLKLLGGGSHVDGRAGLAVLLVVAGGIGGLAWGSTDAMRLWLGDWIEVKDTSSWGYDVSPVSRRFERGADGMTRVYAPDGTPGESADFRCDGRSYPAAGRGGASSPDRSGTTLVCKVIDPWTHRYVVSRPSRPDAIAYLTETISRDGETMELTVRRVGSAAASETSRTLARLR